MKKICIVCLAMLFGGCTFEPPTKPAENYENPVSYSDESNVHPEAERFQAYLNHAVAEGLPGAVLLIRSPRHGTWVGTAGYADITSGVAWKPSTLSRVGSVTKLFTGTIMVLLEDQGVLDLEDPAKRYLSDDVVAHIDNAESCTIRQLLNHTSGINNYLASPSLLMEAYGSYEYRYQPKEKLLQYSFDKQAEFAPGSGWDYSNSNFLLLEMIAERASGKDSRTLMDSLIFQPLQLKSTRYNPGGAVPNGLARGYSDHFADGSLIDVTDTKLEHFHYDGGIISNVYDIADFAEALFLSPFLSESAKAELLTTVPTRGVSERGTDFYGSGIILEKHPIYGDVYGHSGTANGYTAHVYHVVEHQITVAAIVNGSQNTIEDRSYRWFSPLDYDDILKLVVK